MRNRMNRRLAFLAFGAICALPAQQKAPQQKQKAAAPAAKSAKPAPGPLELPKDAVPVAPETWTYKDPQGKPWLYRRTPFGLVRMEQKPNEPAAAPGASGVDSSDTTAVEDGDTVRFERPGPFGKYRWQRKKTELDEWEQAVWNRVKAKAEAPKTAPAKPE